MQPISDTTIAWACAAVTWACAAAIWLVFALIPVHATSINGLPAAGAVSPTDTIAVCQVATGCGTANPLSRATIGSVMAGGLPLAPGFYVSPTGNDSNAGTASAPFASLTACQSAMQASAGIKTCYIRAGSYAPGAASSNCDGDSHTCAVDLTAADNGETWSYYPPDGYDSALITGGSTASGNGPNANNITFNGLTLHHFDYGGIDACDAGNLTVENSIFHDGYNIYTATAYLCDYDDAPGAVSIVGGQNFHFLHNVIYNMGYSGVSATVGSPGVPGLSISGLVYDSNVLYLTNNASYYPIETFAMYTQDNNYLTAPSVNLRITNNYIRDYGQSYTDNSRCIYLDNNTSNADVESNICTGIGSVGVFMHGGINDVVVNNIDDMTGAATGGFVMAYQTSGSPSTTPMTGNIFTNNTIIMNAATAPAAGVAYPFIGAAAPGNPVVWGNAYYNYGVGSLTSWINGSASPGGWNDAAPFSTSNPGFSGCYAASIPNIPGKWGPPGYQIPNTGTAPSYSSPTC
jgi:hypothetical protein